VKIGVLFWAFRVWDLNESLTIFFAKFAIGLMYTSYHTHRCGELAGISQVAYNVTCSFIHAAENRDRSQSNPA